MYFKNIDFYCWRHFANRIKVQLHMHNNRKLNNCCVFQFQSRNRCLRQPRYHRRFSELGIEEKIITLSFKNTFWYSYVFGVHVFTKNWKTWPNVLWSFVT